MKKFLFLYWMCISALASQEMLYIPSGVTITLVPTFIGSSVTVARWTVGPGSVLPCNSLGTVSTQNGLGVYTAPAVTTSCNVQIGSAANTNFGPQTQTFYTTIYPLPSSGLGTQGPPGPQGPSGQNGQNGVSPTILFEPIGGNCANAGTKITDSSGNNTYVCNGIAGTPGPSPKITNGFGIIMSGDGYTVPMTFQIDPSATLIWTKVPSVSSSPCLTPYTDTNGNLSYAGNYAIDDNFVYVCKATGSLWKRIPLSSW